MQRKERSLHTRIASKFFAIAIVLGLAVTSGCGGAASPNSDGTQQRVADSAKDEPFLGDADGKSDSIFAIEPGSPKAKGILELVNSASFETLDDDVSLDVRAARNIEEARNENRIDTLQALDDIPWVGKRAFRKLYFYAKRHGYFDRDEKDESDDSTVCDSGDVCPDGATCSESGDYCIPDDCTLEEAFERKYGQPWDPSRVAFETRIGLRWGVDALSTEHTSIHGHPIVDRSHQGPQERVVEIRLYEWDSQKILAKRAGKYLDGLATSLVQKRRGLKGNVVKKTLLRQFVFDAPSKPQQVARLQVLLADARAKVPTNRRSDYDRASDELLTAIADGRIELSRGDYFELKFDDTSPYLDGNLAFRYASAWGTRPELGVRGDGFDTIWVDYRPNPVCAGLREFESEGTRFVRVDTTETWTDAEKTCNKFGGHLATVESVVQNSALRATSPQDEYMIGLNDRATEGTFEWVSGSTSTYRRWDDGQPDNWQNQEDCVVVTDSGDLNRATWNDFPCDRSRPFVCELSD